MKRLITSSDVKKVILETCKRALVCFMRFQVDFGAQIYRDGS